MELSPHLQRIYKEATLAPGASGTPPEAQAAFALCQALDNDSFQFGLEPIHTLESKSQNVHFRREETGVLPMEYLLRTFGTDGNPLNIGQGLQFLRERGLSSFFDMAVIPKAIEKALQYGEAGLPVSVNIAPESLRDDLFLDDLSQYLDTIQDIIKHPRHIVFEVPFTGQTKPETLSWIKKRQAEGYRFAVDNFGHYKPIELEAVGRTQPAFIKIDGVLIQGALAGDESMAPKLRKLVEALRRVSPASRLIAPWVTSVTQAKRLYQVYKIDAVQGRELTKDRTLFSSQWALMAYADAPTNNAASVN